MQLPVEGGTRPSGQGLSAQQCSSAGCAVWGKDASRMKELRPQQCLSSRKQATQHHIQYFFISLILSTVFHISKSLKLGWVLVSVACWPGDSFDVVVIVLIIYIHIVTFPLRFEYFRCYRYWVWLPFKM